MTVSVVAEKPAGKRRRYCSTFVMVALLFLLRARADRAGHLGIHPVSGLGACGTQRNLRAGALLRPGWRAHESCGRAVLPGVDKPVVPLP